MMDKPQLFWRERRPEAVSNRGPSASQPNALPLDQTGSHEYVAVVLYNVHLRSRADSLRSQVILRK